MENYYIQIDGRKYDKSIVNLLEQVYRNNEDPSIDIPLMEEIVRRLRDGGKYTQVEENTVVYITQKYSWDLEVRMKFNDEINKIRLDHNFTGVNTYEGEFKIKGRDGSRHTFQANGTFEDLVKAMREKLGY